MRATVVLFLLLASGCSCIVAKDRRVRLRTGTATLRSASAEVVRAKSASRANALTWASASTTSTPTAAGAESSSSSSSSIALDPLAYRTMSVWGDAPYRRLYLVGYEAGEEAVIADQGQLGGASGPSRSELVSALARHGATLLSYVPDATLVVAARPEAMAAVVSETGAETAEYGTEHCIAPEWSPLLGTQSGGDGASGVGRQRRRLLHGLVARDGGSASDQKMPDRSQSLDAERDADSTNSDSMSGDDAPAETARAGFLGRLGFFDPRVVRGGPAHEERRRRHLSGGQTAPRMYQVKVRLIPGLTMAALSAAAKDWPAALSAALAAASASSNSSTNGSNTGGGAGACLPVVISPAASTASGTAVCGNNCWLQVFLCEPDLAAGVRWLASQPVVRWVAPRMQLQHRNAASSILVETGDLTLAQYADPVGSPSDEPSRRPYRAAGLDGSGEVVGLGDTGIDLDLCYFADPRVNATSYRSLLMGYPPRYRPADHRKLAQYYLVPGALFGDDPVVEQFSGHGTHTSGSVGGAILATSDPYGPYSTDIATGAAPRAKISMVDIGIPPAYRGDLPYIDAPYPVDTQYLPLHTAVGASITSDSWGTDYNIYDDMAQGYDRFLWNNPDVISFVAAGNNGSEALVPGGTIGTPATAKNVVAVGMGLRIPEAAGLGYMMLLVRGFEGNSTSAAWSLVMMPDENPNLPSLSGILPRNKQVPFVLAQPIDACSALANKASDIRGTIVLIMRGGCTFAQKAAAVVNAGGAAAVIANNDPIIVGAPVVPRTLRIPVSLITQGLGSWLIGNITAGMTLTVSSEVVPVTIDTLNPSSSYGPIADGRIKPDIVAPGVQIVSAGASGGITGGACSKLTRNMTGTSMATPQASGHTARIRQYFRTGYYPAGSPADPKSAPFTPSGMLLKATIIAGAVAMEGGLALQLGVTLGSGPDGYQGWGRMSLAGSLPLPGFTDPRVALQVADRGQLAATGEQVVIRGLSATGTGPISIVLTWYDYPADLNAAVQLVNDLDMVVQVGPTSAGNSGYTVLGNNAEDAASPSADRVNTVERVQLAAPPAGSPLTVTVKAARIASAGLSSLPQRFAVAVVGHVTGSLETPLNPDWVAQQARSSGGSLPPPTPPSPKPPSPRPPSPRPPSPSPKPPPPPTVARKKSAKAG